MIRRFNYTRRKRIGRDKITVEIIEDAADKQFQVPRLNLDDMDLPPDANLIIEAKRDRFSERFPWGTVANPRPPSDASLNALPPNPSFRLMVVAADGSSRLLALADNIKPQRDVDGGAESLLWMEHRDLGQEVWRLDFGENDNPTLFVNDSIPGIGQAVREDGAFRGAVIPEALRSILIRALIVDNADPTDDEGQWSDWLTLVQDFHDAQFPAPSDDDDADTRNKLEWIEGAVAAFTADRFRAKDNYAAARS